MSSEAVILELDQGDKKTKSRTAEKWYDKINKYIDDGYSQQDMADAEGLTRERMRQIMNVVGLHDKWKAMKNGQKNTCRACGKLLNKTMHYCKEHSPITKYEEDHTCKSCGKKTKMGLRSLGLCRKCYNKEGRKDYERPKRECKLCGKIEYICSDNLCIKCYNRLKSRIKSGTPIAQWRRVYNIEFEKDLIKQIGGEKLAKKCF